MRGFITRYFRHPRRETASVVATFHFAFRQLRRARARYLDSLACAEKFPHVIFHDGALADPACRFGDRVTVWDNTKLHGCQVGRYTYLAPDSLLIGCRVGQFCSIGPELRAGLGTHPSHVFVSTHPSFFSTADACEGHFTDQQKFVERITVTIGNDVWVGARVTILDGVTIGDGAIIGANSLVTRDVEPYGIVGGVPARPIAKRFPDDEVRFLRALAWWDRDTDWIQRYAQYFDSVDRLRNVLEKTPVADRTLVGAAASSDREVWLESSGRN